ncbi:MAG: hypothetical protein JWR50_3178 [Mucilaginibacter sp.]|nr:hypothetical protein [Mucilaginibacter sp.]
METRELFINGVSVDFFSDDQPIPLIFQVNDLGDLTSLQGDGSKMFKLPLTQKNREIFGFPDDITITTNIPYTKLPAKYTQDGMELVPNGLTEVKDAQGGDNGYIDIMLLFGNIDFLDNLGGQIYDMGDSTTIWSGFGTNLVWKQYDHIWNVSNAAHSQNKTEGWIWPVVNYGNIDTTPPFSGHINVRNMRPGFFLHTAIELLVQSTGYSIDRDKSCIYNDPVFANLYKRLIIQFDNSDFEHGSDFQNTPDNLGVTLGNGLDQIISNPRVADVISADIHRSDFPFSGVINLGPTDHYFATTTVNFTATLQFSLFMKGKMTGKQPAEVIIKFTIVNTDGSFSDFAATSFTMDQRYTRLSGSGGSIIGQEEFINQKISQDFSLVSGQQLFVRYHINNVGQSYGDTYAIFKRGASLSIVTNEKLVLWKQPIQCERILPDVAQLDLLKDTLQRQGLILIADPNTGTIIFTSFKTIVGNIPIAKDWSDKCVDIGKQNSFQIGKYCQVNKLKYQEDSAIPLNYMPKYFADDHIDIDDRTLNPNQPVQDLFTSLFSPSINRSYIGGSIAQMSNPTSTDEFSVGSQPRILVDQKVNLLNAGPNGSSITVVFSDGDPGFESQTISINDVISLPYFYKPDAPDLGGGAPRHLAWKDLPGTGSDLLPGLRSTYLTQLQQILTQSKKVTRYLMLSPRDINERDFTIPIYLRQDGCYFYIAKIDSWIKNTPTKVDLIKLYQ